MWAISSDPATWVSTHSVRQDPAPYGGPPAKRGGAAGVKDCTKTAAGSRRAHPVAPGWRARGSEPKRRHPSRSRWPKSAWTLRSMDTDLLGRDDLGMARAKSAKQAVEQLRRLCLALPEAEEKPFGGHTAPAFRVRDKLFVMTSEDGTTMNRKGAPGVQQALTASDPDRFFVPRDTGKNGWIGARLDVEQDWDEIAELVEESWRRTAPKTLVAQFEAAAE